MWRNPQISFISDTRAKMCSKILKIVLFIIFIEQEYFTVESSGEFLFSKIYHWAFTLLLKIVSFTGFQLNKSSHHVRRSSVDDAFFKNQKSSYRSFQPVAIKYHKTSYPRADDRPTDYDITSYDSEYGGVVSNFTSSIYDDNPPLYPNPEFIARSNQGKHRRK